MAKSTSTKVRGADEYPVPKGNQTGEQIEFRSETGTFVVHGKLLLDANGNLYSEQAGLDGCVEIPAEAFITFFGRLQ